MKKKTTLLALAAGAALLTACGSAAETPIAPVAAPQVAVPSSAGQAAVPSASAPAAPVADPAASVEVDDQSGDGRSVVVGEVRLSGGPGWVVVRTDDDGDGRVLGSAPVQSGRSGPITVTLTEPLPGSQDDLTAVLHLDDGDGVFDERSDPAVLDEDDDGDRDDSRGDDVEDDDFDYRVG